MMLSYTSPSVAAPLPLRALLWGSEPTVRSPFGLGHGGLDSVVLRTLATARTNLDDGKMFLRMPLESGGRLIIAHRDRAQRATERWARFSRPLDSSNS